MFAPVNPPIKWYHYVPTFQGSQGGASMSSVPLVNITTQLHVRLRATWEGFDYNHVDLSDRTSDDITPPTDTDTFTFTTTKISDPYNSAEMDYKHQLMQMENNS